MLPKFPKVFFISLTLSLVIFCLFPNKTLAAVFVNDTFTDTAGTSLASHAGETGATWISSSGTAVIDSSGRLRSTIATAATYYASGIPASADYDLDWDVHVNAIPGGTFIVGVAARFNVTSHAHYTVEYNRTSGLWRLYRYPGTGAGVLLASWQGTITAGATYHAEFSLRGDLLTLSIDGTQRISVTDASPITAAGRVGIDMWNTAADGSGIVLDNLSATDPLVATLYTLTGPTGGVINATSTVFTLIPNSLYTGTITPVSSGAGTFSPTSLTWSGDSAAKTFTYTPTSTSGSPHTISVTSLPAIVDPAPVSYTVTAITYTLTGPMGGVINATSTNFTITPNGLYTGTITPTSTGTGTFSPTSLTWSGDSAAKTFTYTPTSTSGSPHTISVTSLPAIVDPASVSYTVTLPQTSISVNDPALYWSRDNVYVNGSSYALMLTLGSYLKTNFSGTSITVNLDVSAFVSAGALAANYPIVRYQIDGGSWTSTQLAPSTTNLIVSGLSPGAHSFRFEYVTTRAYPAPPGLDKWNTPASVIKITGLSIDEGAAVSVPTIFSKTLRVDGDSITEGLRVVDSTDTPTSNSAILAYPYLLAGLLNTELTQIGYGGQGWLGGGTANIPTYPNAVGYYYNGVSRLTSGVLPHSPDYWLINEGVNDSGDVTSAAQTRLGQARTEAGAATQIFLLVPFNGSHRAQITSAYNAYVAATPSDTKVHLIDLGSISFGTTDGTHPNTAGHQTLATALALAINTVIEIPPTAPTISASTPLSSTAIHWNFTDNADNETGFRVYTNVDAIATSSATANLTYLDETGLSENTQYTRYVKAYNSYGESASSSATSTYTLADTPTNLTVTNTASESLTLSVDTFPNATSGSSGYYFANTTKGTNSGWLQTNSWQETGLDPNTSYTYTIKYRNGDGIETTTATTTQYTLIQAPASISFDSIGANSLTVSASGTLSNIASSSSGLYFDEISGNSGGVDSAWLQINSYQNIGLSENTQYIYRVKARNGDGTATSYTATSSKYTLADTPTNLTVTNTASESLTLSVDTFPNATSGSSGYYFANTTKGTNSGWLQTNSWQETGLTCHTSYIYGVQYRNDEGVETSTSTRTLSTNGCAAPSSRMAPVSNSTNQISTSTTQLQQLSTSTSQTSQTNLEQITIQQLQAQITTIRRQITVWLTQLIQIIQQQIFELQNQLSRL